jgi:hypothetical protein
MVGATNSDACCNSGHRDTQCPSCLNNWHAHIGVGPAFGSSVSDPHGRGNQHRDLVGHDPHGLLGLLPHVHRTAILEVYMVAVRRKRLGEGWRCNKQAQPCRDNTLLVAR